MRFELKRINNNSNNTFSALQQRVTSPTAVEEVKRHSLFVHQLTNTPCELNLQSALPDAWSDGMEHNCRKIKEMVKEAEMLHRNIDYLHNFS